MSQRRRNARSQRSTSQIDSEDPNYSTEDIVNNVVRYIIFRAGEHLLFSKSELVRQLIHKSGDYFEDIMQRANGILENVYGYKIIQCNSAKGKEKLYAVTNIVPHIKDANENEGISNEESSDSDSTEALNVPDDVYKILILLILSHILMANSSVSETSLYAFLKSLDIDVEVKHPIFGRVKEHITKTLVRQHYLHCETDSISKMQTFQWGSRAESEISKEAVLQFVCDMYKNRKPKDWTQQYKVATTQFQRGSEDTEE